MSSVIVCFETKTRRSHCYLSLDIRLPRLGFVGVKVRTIRRTRTNQFTCTTTTIITTTTMFCVRNNLRATGETLRREIHRSALCTNPYAGDGRNSSDDKNLYDVKLTLLLSSWDTFFVTDLTKAGFQRTK